MYRMNREDTKKAIEVMQAYVNGTELEYRVKPDGISWHRVSSPVWSWGQDEYRIKPKPREFFISAFCKNGDHLMPPSYAKNSTDFIRVREVIE